MIGTLVLQGGGPFMANDDLDATLFAPHAPGSIGNGRVVVLPTADAFEHPERLVAAAMQWGERLGVEIEALMVMRRAEAMDVSAAAAVSAARAVYIVGDQPLHLRSVLKDTPLWHAIVSLRAAGGLVAASGGSAAALCDPMVDPRGGAFTLGLGMVPGLALVTESETWSSDRLHRTLSLANTTVAILQTGQALVHDGSSWLPIGEPDVRGDLPPA